MYGDGFYKHCYRVFGRELYIIITNNLYLIGEKYVKYVCYLNYKYLRYFFSMHICQQYIHLLT